LKLSKLWLEKPSRFVVEREKAISSRDADYSPSYVSGLENNVIFTSTRNGTKGKRKSAITGQRNGDLFRASYNIQKQRWDAPVTIDEENLINTIDDEGAASLSSDGSQIYFTRCKFDKRSTLGSQVLVAKKSRDMWSEATSLSLVPDSLIAAHPTVSSDGQTLYFVSDMGEGYGGLDIWKVEMLSGDWGAPENMGPEINTPGNEVFPFIRDNGELYFSSDYHPGLGGLDIFKAVSDEETKTWKIENMQAPINSQGDDFSITFLPKRDQGMLASNRKGSMGDDLYSFVLPPLIFRVEGQIVNSLSDLRENNAFVRIIGTDGTNLKVRSTDGKFQFRLLKDTEYIFAAFKDGFLNAKKNISTYGLEESKLYEVSLTITPTDAPINVENIGYEFGQHALLPSSVVALDSLVGILKQNPTIVVEIMAHTDHIGSLEFNSALSQRRAQSVVDFLIGRGVSPNRLVAKGYGETWPKKVTEGIATKYDFLIKGEELNELYINKLATEEQKEIAKSLNRRTEFRVLRSDFREAF
jgi:peptidoglycan-associated lipoprotein